MLARPHERGKPPRYRPSIFLLPVNVSPISSRPTNILWNRISSSDWSHYVTYSHFCSPCVAHGHRRRAQKKARRERGGKQKTVLGHKRENGVGRKTGNQATDVICCCPFTCTPCFGVFHSRSHHKLPRGMKGVHAPTSHLANPLQAGVLASGQHASSTPGNTVEKLRQESNKELPYPMATGDV